VDYLTPLLHKAGAQCASDLAFDPVADGGLVALARIRGEREVLGRIPAEAAASTLARLKALARLPAYIIDEIQDGRLDGTPFGIAGDVRVAVLPTVRGQRVALRLPAIATVPTPDDLGLPLAVVAGLRRLLARPDGLIVVTGPTGSGKTTTIHSLLLDQATTRPDRQIVTIEDPVERRLPGLAQVEVAAHRGLGFLEALAAALRQDADVLVVGEVRDGATAQACLRAALTGHLVITTVHAGRAAAVAPRLIEMGCAPDLLLPALTGILAQRLLRGPDGGTVVLGELLTLNDTIRAHLRRGEPPAISDDLDAQAAAALVARRTDAIAVARALA
jgi:type II secretory ATPase GspE/PulE/Tfp pilus assembly ATPase PilB-like protein